MNSRTYKLSKYNFIINSNDELIIFNTFTRKCFKTRKDDNEVLRLMDNPNCKDKNNNCFNILFKKGIIINEDVNEDELVDYEYYKMAYSNDTMEIVIIPTDNCNLQCIYCYQREGKNFISNDAKNNILKFIDKNISRYKKLYINWFGGEALLLKNVVVEMTSKIKAICWKHGVSFIARITTNGYELDIETFDKLVRSNVLLYSITIDGVKEVHDRQRPAKNGQSSYDKIMSNLIDIKNNIKTNNFTIDIRTNISNSSKYIMNQYLDIYKKNFGDDIRFNLVLEAVHDWHGERINNHKNEVVYDMRELDWVIELALDKGIIVKNYMKYQLNNHICIASKKNGFVIDYNGAIHKCDMAMYDEKYKKINCIGHIDKYGKMSIDNEKEAKWIVRGQISDMCRECLAYPYCMGIQCIFGKKFLHQQRCEDTISFIKWSALTVSKNELL